MHNIAPQTLVLAMGANVVIMGKIVGEIVGLLQYIMFKILGFRVLGIE